jgi:hypothetical protein
MASVQPASARPLPPGDPTAIYATSTRSASAPIVVHDHLSVWAYLLVAAITVAATLAVLWAVSAVRLASSGRQAKQLQSA